MVKRWLKIGLLAALASAMLQTAALRAWDDAKPAAGRILISDVIIHGNHLMSAEQIRAQLHIHVGEEYNPAKIDEDVRQLYKTNRFNNIQILREGDGPDRIKIYFLLREMPNKIQKVTFRGAKHLKEDDLRNLTGIHPDSSLNPKLNQEACRRIEEKYAETGRQMAHCTLVKGGERSDTEVIFDITEGPKTKIKDIKFVGNTFVSGARLMTDVPSAHEWFAAVGSTYNNEKADNDCKALMDYYRKAGFFDVRVALERQRSENGCEVALIFHINEGLRFHSETEKSPPARVGQIIVVGNDKISTESILAHVPLFPGQALSYPELKEAEKTLADLGLFVVDPATGTRPTITVVDPDGDGAFKDIRIMVQEKRKTKQKNRQSR